MQTYGAASVSPVLPLSSQRLTVGKGLTWKQMLLMTQRDFTKAVNDNP